MKIAPTTRVLILTIVLAALTWAFFYVVPPRVPLGIGETLAVVGVSAVVVVLVQSLVSRLRRHGDKKEDEGEATENP